MEYKPGLMYHGQILNLLIPAVSTEGCQAKKKRKKKKERKKEKENFDVDIKEKKCIHGFASQKLSLYD